MKRKFLWMLTAILISGAMMTLSSCSKDDDQTGPGPLAEKLSGGTWYCIYEAWGVAEEDGPGSAEAAYCVVVDIYHFQPDGTGHFQRCFFDNESPDPVMTHGTLGYGAFSYISHDDGTVDITLTNDWGQSIPKRWNVTYFNEAVYALGVDGQMLTLEHIDDET